MAKTAEEAILECYKGKKKECFQEFSNQEYIGYIVGTLWIGFKGAFDAMEDLDPNMTGNLLLSETRRLFKEGRL